MKMPRLANKFDLPILVEMMRGYAQQSPIAALADEKMHDERHVENLLLSLILGRGFVLIDEGGRGMLAAMVTPNFWCPEVMELKEIAWWVKPEFRRGSVGGRLFIEFDKIAKAYLAQNRVQVVCLSLLSSSEINSLPGYRQIESTFVRD